MWVRSGQQRKTTLTPSYHVFVGRRFHIHKVFSFYIYFIFGLTFIFPSTYRTMAGIGPWQSTFHTHLLFFSSLSLSLSSFSTFLPLYFYTNISFSPHPIATLPVQERKGVSFGTSLVCLSFSPHLHFSFFFCDAGKPILMFILDIFIVSFPEVEFLIHVFDVLFLVDHIMSLFCFLLEVSLTWLLLFLGRQQIVVFFLSTITACPIFSLHLASIC